MNPLEMLLANTAINVFNEVIGQVIGERIPFAQANRVSSVAKTVIDMQADGEISAEDAVNILRILTKYNHG